MQGCRYCEQFLCFDLRPQLQDGRSCFCGSSYGRHGPGSCDSRCEGNTTEVRVVYHREMVCKISLNFDHQTCGGKDSNTIYGTGFSLPGPPATLNMISATTTSIYINWTSPVSTNGQLEEYQVSLTLLSSHHPTSGRRSPLLQRFSASADSARLGDLLPGSKYKVEVAAVSQEGVGPPISK